VKHGKAQYQRRVRPWSALGVSVKNEIRYVEVMIGLAEDKTLYCVLAACQEKHLLGQEIVEYKTELLGLRTRKDALREKWAETSIESTSAVMPSNSLAEPS
jgi:hypothetical protein